MNAEIPTTKLVIEPVSNRTKRHPWSREIHHRISGLYALDNWHCAAALMADYSVLAIAIGMPFWAAHLVGFWPTYLLISLPLIGARQRALAHLLHDSAHRILARSARWNFIAGTLLSGYLVLQGWTTYHSSHVCRHHPNLGIRGKDPDFDAHVEGGVYETQGRFMFLWRNIIGPVFLTRTPAKLRDLLVNRLWNPSEPAGETALRLFWLGGVLSAILVFGLWRELLLFWVVPLLTTFPLFNWWIELFEHYPLARPVRSDLETTRNRWTGRFVQAFTGIHNEYLHQVHHLWVRVPFWNLPAAHEVLMEDPEYRECQLLSVGLFTPMVLGIPSLLDAILPEQKEAS